MSNATTSDFVEGLTFALETLAFVCVGPADAQAAPTEPVLCTMACSGTVSVRLHMIAPLSLGHLIAANMLGVEPSDPQATDRALDSLREAMNVSCGALCSRFAATSPTAISLGLPETAPLDADQWTDALARPDTQLLDADGHVIAVWLEEAT